MFRLIIITVFLFLFSISSVFAIEKKDMNRYSAILCPEFNTGANKQELDVVEGLKFFGDIEQKENIFYFKHKDLWNASSQGAKETMLMRISFYYACRYPGPSGDLKTIVELRLKTGETVGRFSYEKRPGEFPSPGIVFTK